MFPVNSMDGADECRDISILNNLAIEKTENFSLHIIDVEENVFLHIEWLTIHIRDDDCKGKLEVGCSDLAKKMSSGKFSSEEGGGGGELPPLNLIPPIN